MCISVENAKNSRLLALFNSLDEDEKDIVINMSESLAIKYQGYTTDFDKNNSQLEEKRRKVLDTLLRNNF